MKSFVSVIILFISLVSYSQKPIEKTIGEFTELKVYDLIEVELVKSNENKVVISGKNNTDVLVNNKSGKLKIKMNLEEIFDGSSTKVMLYYTSVDIIDVNEGAKIYSNDKIKQLGSYFGIVFDPVIEPEVINTVLEIALAELK